MNICNVHSHLRNVKLWTFLRVIFVDTKNIDIRDTEKLLSSYFFFVGSYIDCIKIHAEETVFFFI